MRPPPTTATSFTYVLAYTLTAKMLKSMVYIRPLASIVPCGAAWLHTSVDLRNRLVGRSKGTNANQLGPSGDQSTGQSVPPPHTLFHVYFDTLRTTQELQKAGYSEQQAQVLIFTLNDALHTTLQRILADRISPKDLEVVRLQVKSEMESVRNSMAILERNAIGTLRSDSEALKAQVERLRDEMKEETSKVQSGMRLDLNLERSRNKEEYTKVEQSIKDTNNRIVTEVAELRTQIASQKLESIKYLAGGIFSVVTIVLSVMLGLSRLLK